jgi:hypothetical protein
MEKASGESFARTTRKTAEDEEDSDDFNNSLFVEPHGACQTGCRLS